MTVFISWSGRESKHVAAALNKWLPNIIQGLETFMSDDDIPPGVRWFSDIASELEDSNYGIICVTPDNQESPWLNFEAGAIGKQTDKAFVTPFAISLRKEQIVGPLAGFNAVNSDKAGFLSLVKSINASLPNHAPEGAVLSAAKAFWSEVDEDLQARPKGTKPAPSFDPNEALKEVRELVRQLARDQQDEREAKSVPSPSGPGRAPASAAAIRDRARSMSTEALISRMTRLQAGPGRARPGFLEGYARELYQRGVRGDVDAAEAIAALRSSNAPWMRGLSGVGHAVDEADDV